MTTKNSVSGKGAKNANTTQNKANANANDKGTNVSPEEKDTNATVVSKETLIERFKVCNERIGEVEDAALVEKFKKFSFKGEQLAANLKIRMVVDEMTTLNTIYFGLKDKAKEEVKEPESKEEKKGKVADKKDTKKDNKKEAEKPKEDKKSKEKEKPEPEVEEKAEALPKAAPKEVEVNKPIWKFIIRKTHWNPEEVKPKVLALNEWDSALALQFTDKKTGFVQTCKIYKQDITGYNSYSRILGYLHYNVKADLTGLKESKDADIQNVLTSLGI